MKRIESFNQNQLEENFFLMTGLLMTGLFDFLSYSIGLGGTRWRTFTPALIISLLISDSILVAFGAGISEGKNILLVGALLGMFALATISGLTKSKKPIWAGFSTRLSDTGLVLSFMEEDDIPFESVAKIVKDFNIDVAGIMHTDVNAVSKSLKVLRNFFDGPLMVYPDSGGWVSPNWDFDRVIQPRQLKSFAEKWIKEGVNIIGGCCGLSPNHIREIAQLK